MSEKKFLLMVYCIAFLAGLFFLIFNPHTYGPWGFDGYDTLAWNLAEGNGYSFDTAPPFEPTAFRLPGYVLFVAVFYKIFGHNYLPVHIAQLILSAFIPLVIFYTVKMIGTDRLARVSSICVAALGITNAYAGTVVTEVLTVLMFTMQIFLFIKAAQTMRTKWFVAAGLVAGYASIIRPGLILMPALLIPAFYFYTRRDRSIRKKSKRLVCYALSIFIVFVPWVVRNYSLAGHPILLGTQGGSQFLYGVLESGEYFRRRFAHPKAHYEELNAYTSRGEDGALFDLISKRPLQEAFINFSVNDAPFDRKRMLKEAGNRYLFLLKPASREATIRYFFEAKAAGGDVGPALLPPLAPYSTFRHHITKDIFSDLDRNDEFLDVYDFVDCARMAVSGHQKEPVKPLKYDYDHNGVVDKRDLDIIAWAILHFDDLSLNDSGETVRKVSAGASSVNIDFIDDSNMSIPANFSTQSKKVELSAGKGEAFEILNGSVNKVALDAPPAGRNAYGIYVSGGADRYGIKSELNRQYLQKKLGLLLLKEDPGGYIISCFKRMFSMWVTMGSSDISISHPPPGGHYLYFRLAAIFSASIFVLGIAGACILRAQTTRFIFLLVPIIYFPLTHSFMMANARHTLPANPYLLVFCAVFFDKVYDKLKNKVKRRRD